MLVLVPEERKPSVPKGTKRSSRRAAANKSQKFIKEMAEDLAREDYEDEEEDEYGVEEPIYDRRRVLPKVNNGQQERKGGETNRLEYRSFSWQCYTCCDT